MSAVRTGELLGGTAYDRVLDRLRADARQVRQVGASQAKAQCPAHEDRNPSLSVTGIPDTVLLHCHAGCNVEDVLAALGLTKADLYDDPRGARHLYRDADGVLLRTVHRTPDKRFLQSGDTKGVPTLYRLPEVLAAVKAEKTIHLVEGEKDVHAIEATGGVATTAPMGALSFSKADVSPLHGANVVAVVDQDKAGQRWAAAVASSLDGRAASLRFVRPATGKDSADHVAAGYGLAEFVPIDVEDDVHDEDRLEDAHLAETVANRALRGRVCFSRGLGWLKYVKGCWRPVGDDQVVELVRKDLMRMADRESRRSNARADRLRALGGLLAAGRIRAIAQLCRGILARDDPEFDQHPQLLCVGNGVVDLSTGQLQDWDPDLLLTKTTDVPYVAGATSSDWDAALGALPPEVAGHLQVRFGQAATGHPTSDDLLPVLQGGGSNGKTTIVGAVTHALGQHAVVVPEKVLIGGTSEHPTELMPLKGARVAIIEETPEARRLSVKRLKDLVGTPTMTARLIRRDYVTWAVTHSLILTTNYIPRIEETDHGTWRRLALIKFPFTYAQPGQGVTGPMVKASIPGLRERLRDGRQGQHEAVLAWLVDGAQRWYDTGQVMPPLPSEVVADTSAWREQSDLIYAYITERLCFDRTSHAMSAELLDDFNLWSEGRGHHPWTMALFSGRFAGHSLTEAEHVEGRRLRRGALGLSRREGSRTSPPKQYQAFSGLRFRTEADEVRDAE